MAEFVVGDECVVDCIECPQGNVTYVKQDYLYVIT